MAAISPDQQQLSLRHNVPGTVYVLHFEPAYKHAQHYVGWTQGDVCERLVVHLQGRGSPLIRAAVAAGVDVQLAATYEGTRYLERRLKRWHHTSRFCAICHEHERRTSDRHDTRHRARHGRSLPGTHGRRPAGLDAGARDRTVRDWLTEHMRAHQLTSADVARCIGRDHAMVRGWFGVRGRDWRTQSPNRFVIHIISERTIEHVGIALTGNPRLVPELYPHMAEPVCQRCGAPTDCDHLGHELGRLAA